MKATKHTMVITMEVLHKDSLIGLISQHFDTVFGHEVEEGILRCEDGDTISWKTESKPVAF